MKRVLWICNIMLPVIAKQLKLSYSNREGWLTGIFEQLVKEKKEKTIELGICFPIEAWKEPFSAERTNPLMVKGIPCYGFLEDLGHPENYEPKMEERFREILDDFKPDIIHIFGTEFPHALAAARAFGRPESTLIGIQGLCGKIAEVYQAGLPEKVWNQVTFRDLIRKDSLKQQQEKFARRGQQEKKTIQLAGHITGRTRFDREGTAAINPKAVYHKMNETMRNSFYEGSWKASECQKHSIFMGQGDYPLKGFHFMLDAMELLTKKYPDAVLYVAGNSIIQNGTLKEKIKLSAYGKYLLSLVQKYRLEDKVIILGKLTEEEMKQQFLKSSVFVCPSVLENSPNTVGEAMLLGVPVVASMAGGIPDMITDGKEGLLFQAGDSKALFEAIDTLWQETRDNEGKTLAERISEEERNRAAQVHDGTANYRRLMEIYAEIGEKG